MKKIAARLAGFGLVAFLSLYAGVPAAGADGRAPLEVLDSGGAPDVLAGSHPDRMITNLVRPETAGPPENLKDLTIDFPPGMGGDPTSVPVCHRAVFDFFGEFEAPACPVESQVGQLVVVKEGATEKLPVYALEPAPGEVAAFGLGVSVLRLKFSGHLRATDFGLSMRLEGLPQQQPGGEEEGETIESYFEFWGVPADHQGEVVLEGETPQEAAERPSIPRKPFLTLPTRCGAPLEVTLHERRLAAPGGMAQQCCLHRPASDRLPGTAIRAQGRAVAGQPDHRHAERRQSRSELPPERRP